jgi:DnaD/phage-associated family protein
MPPTPPTDNIFSLYENNIGMLTPIMADKLKLAEEIYPASWIAEAIGEAVQHEARNWSYVDAILKNRKSGGSNGKVKNSGKVSTVDKSINAVQEFLRENPE